MKQRYHWCEATAEDCRELGLIFIRDTAGAGHWACHWHQTEPRDPEFWNQHPRRQEGLRTKDRRTERGTGQ